MTADPIAELCAQLKAFHISLRQQRIAAYEDEYSLEATWTGLLNISPSLFIGGFPRPKPGRRPCWEPPHIFPWQLSQLETLIEVQKELAIRDGNANGEIAWRTDFMDNLVEKELLSEYEDWIFEEYADAAKVPGNAEEKRFYKGLKRHLAEEFRIVAYQERDEIIRAHGKTVVEWLEYRERATVIGREKDSAFRVVFS